VALLAYPVPLSHMQATSLGNNERTADAT